MADGASWGRKPALVGFILSPQTEPQTVDQTVSNASLTGDSVFTWDTSKNITAPAALTVGGTTTISSLASAGTQCVHANLNGVLLGTGSDCGSGGGGGTVTTVAGTAPVKVVNGTTTPQISLVNSGGTDVTAALGTDTKYFTASGSAATTGHVVTGDAQGGIADSGKAAPSGAFVGTTDSQSLTNKSIVGSEINSGTVAPTYGGLGQDASAWTGYAKFLSGTAASLTGTQNQIPAYGSAGAPTATNPPFYSPALFGVTSDGTTDTTTAFNSMNQLPKRYRRRLD